MVKSTILPPEILALPCLSIRQPWAWLIVTGHKDVENREWPTKFRGRFLIHAGKQEDMQADRAYFKCVHRVKIPSTFDKGGIVGMATLVDCVTKSDSGWFFGTYGFVLRDAKPLPFYPSKGALGFFKL
jgi:hypothetical protein